MIERAADQWGKARRGGGCDRDRCHDLGQRLAIEQIPRNRPRKDGGGAGAACLYRPADQQACKVAGERAPDRAEHEEAKPDQNRYLPAKSVRQRSDDQLSDGEDREKNRDRRRDGST